jgi:hypothetical protein
VIIAAALAACAGPKPQASVLAVEPSPVAGHERVTLAIDNRSGGEGEVDVRIVMHGPATIVESRTVDLRGHDHVELAVDIAAPPGTYRATVDARFPD